MNATDSSSKDLRGFLRLLEEQRPGDLVHVRQPVSPIQEPTALLHRLELEGRYPVVWFDKVGDSAAPLVMNVHATRERLALALGVTPAELNASYQQRIQNLIEPVLVETGAVQEAGSPDLRALPIITPSANTTAPYIGGGIVVARDPVSGSRNLSYNRLMLRGPTRFTFHPAPGLHLHQIWQNAVARREELPVAVIIGYHPAFALGTLAKVPFGVDEYTCAGGLLQQPVPLVRCRTIPLEVPANAEIVIEGRVLRDVLEEEGPYDEFTGYAMPAEKKPVIQVTAITHRRNPLFQDVMGGGAEHLLMGSIPKAASLEARLRQKHPCVRAVCLPRSGCGRLHAVVSVGASSSVEAHKLIEDLFAMDHFLKHVWVVDADVDVDSDREVLGAMSTTFQGDRDLLVETGQPGTDHDPSAEKGRGAKVGFDCRRKKANFPPRKAISLAALEKMSPDQWIARCSRASVKRGPVDSPGDSALHRSAATTEPSGPGRPPRLGSIFQKYDPPLYFVTLCSSDRKRLFANESIHAIFREFAMRGYKEKGIAVGRYVLMPDHIHLFVRGRDVFGLPQWARMLKQVLGKKLQALGHEPEYWQRGFFDHLIRHSESYAEKWQYVRDNPVRAELVKQTDDWPYQGEIVEIEV